MKNAPTVRRAVRATLLSFAAAAFVAPLCAQESVISEVTVTGSRLRVRDGMETPTPVTAVEVAEIQALAPGNLVEAMSQMPQFLQNSSPANIGSVSGPVGSSFLNLRGVGSNRTLVLLDGRRVASSNRLGVADIALFPEAMIRGMEVVTGGASAAYGSDAVSGVVNFLLDTEFTGLKSHFQGGITERGDNETYEVSLAGGYSLGERTHFIASVDFLKAAEISNYRGRDWYQNWGTVDVNGPGQPTIIARDVRARTYTAGGLIRLPGSALHMTHFLTGGIPAPFQDGTVVGATRQSGGTGFWGDLASKEQDQGGQGSFYPENKRGSAFFYLDHEFNDRWSGFFQYMHGENEVEFYGTGAHQETASWRATIYDDNAFLPESIRTIMVNEGRSEFPLYRYASSADLSRNRANQTNTLNSYTLGAQGDVGETRINAYYQYGRSRSVFTAIDFPRLDRLYRAFDSVLDTNTGRVVCRSTLTHPNDGCIPANPFGAGTMSREAVDYILDGDMWRNSLLEQHFTEVAADRELFDPWGAGMISVAAGVSYRKDKFKQVAGPDDLVALSTLPDSQEGYRGLPPTFVGDNILMFAGISDESIGGEFDVWEGFAETLVPLVRDKVFAKAVDASAAIRYADYSGSGGVLAWKAGLDWRLNDSLRLRVTRSRDTRAGTLAERYDRSTAGGTAYDPLKQQTYSFSTISGGNPDVEPELSDTWTLGFVLTPEALPGFAFSADWYDIKIKDYIAQLGVQRIIDDCDAGAVELCQRITRDAVSQDITWVENVYLNVAQARVTGVDMEMSYQTPISLFTEGHENLSLRLFATWLGENSFSNVGIATRDDAGTTSLPEWTATAILTYGLGPVQTSLTGRYIDSRVQFSDPIAPANQLDDNSVASVFYMNLRTQYKFGSEDGIRKTVYLNVANLLDRDPPVVATWSDFFGASPTVPSLHDALGRRYTLGIEFEF